MVLYRLHQIDDAIKVAFPVEHAREPVDRQRVVRRFFYRDLKFFDRLICSSDFARLTQEEIRTREI